MKLLHPKDTFITRRKVYVTDPLGNLIRIAEVFSFIEANRIGLTYFEDWREVWVEQKLFRHCRVLADDGYVVKVLGFDYKTRILILETGKWKLGTTLELNQSFVTTKPVYKEDVTESVPFPKVKYIRWMKMIQRFLMTLDWKNSCKGIMSVEKANNLIRHDEQFRYLLMSQTASIFAKSGITPEEVLKLVHEKVKDIGDADQALKYLETYSKINPDMENKEYATAPGVTPGTQIFLGDPNNFQEVEAQSQTSTSQALNTPPRQIPEAEVIEEVNGAEVAGSIEVVEEEDLMKRRIRDKINQAKLKANEEAVNAS